MFGVVRTRHFVKCFISKKVIYRHVYHRRLIQPCQYYPFIPRCALRQDHNLFRTNISTKRDLVLPLSISNIFYVPLHHLIAAYVFFPIFSSVFHSIACFKRQFLHKMWPIQLAFPVFILWRIPPLPPNWLNTILLNFSNDRSKFSSPPFYSTTFHKFSPVSVLRAEVSKFQNHTKLCFRFRSRFFWGASSPLCWFNNKGIFVYYTSRLTQLYSLIY